MSVQRQESDSAQIDDVLLAEEQAAQEIYESASEADVGVEQVNQETPEAGSIVFKLSTWTPTKDNVLYASSKGLSISLHPNEQVTFVGQYDLEVHVGTVLVDGAIVRAHDPIVRIFAPSSHPLPSIRCIDGTKSLLRLRSYYNGIQDIASLSPLFRRADETRSNIVVGLTPSLNEELAGASLCYVSSITVVADPVPDLNLGRELRRQPISETLQAT